jgi:Uma2 family endonuclease
MSGGNEISVDTWHSMHGDQGSSHRELLDGEIVVMPEPGPAHADCMNKLIRMLSEALGDRAVLSVQNPIVLDERSEPRPDIAVLRSGLEPGAHPGAADILLLIEVSETPKYLAYDRGRKASYYARSGIPECWIIDLPSSQVLVLRSPASGGYREIRNVRGTGPVEIQQLPDIQFDAADLVGS